MGLFDTLGKVFSPKNIGTVLGGVAGSVLPGVGTALGAGLGRTAAHLTTGDDRTLGSTLGEGIRGAGLGYGATQIPHVGGLIREQAPMLALGGTAPISPGGTPDITMGRTPGGMVIPTTAGATAPRTDTIPQAGGAANAGINPPGGSGEPGRLRRLLTWAEENPELAMGAVTTLGGLYGDYQEGRAEQAQAEYQMRRNEAISDVSAALFRGLAKQLPKAA